MKHQLSIIIPIFNEAETIENLLSHLLKSSSKKNIAELIVVDGGSCDNSLTIVKKFVTSSNSETSELYREVGQIFSQTKSKRPNVVLLSSQKGRAKQMNFGAKHAKGNILYFLHADSLPPNGYDRYILNEIDKGNKAGCFRMRFDSKHAWLKLAGWLTKFNWKASRGGDQSLFITKELFESLGGYDEQFTIYEDIDLINKLYERNEFVIIPKCLTTSARRYNDKGIWKLQYHFWAIYVKKWFGASAVELSRYYKRNVG